jgi:hypothetical protein
MAVSQLPIALQQCRVLLGGQVRRLGGQLPQRLSLAVLPQEHGVRQGILGLALAQEREQGQFPRLGIVRFAVRPQQAQFAERRFVALVLGDLRRAGDDAGIAREPGLFHIAVQREIDIAAQPGGFRREQRIERLCREVPDGIIRFLAVVRGFLGDARLVARAAFCRLRIQIAGARGYQDDTKTDQQANRANHGGRKSSQRALLYQQPL